MKKGLGRIPKSLSWIDIEEPLTPAKPIKEATTKKPKEEFVAASEQVMTAPVTELKTTQKGLPAGWVRATFIVDQELNDKIKALAYWDRLTVKEVMHDALTQYLQDKNVKSMPKKKSLV